MDNTSRFNFSGKLVSLRAIEPEDLDILYKWENDPDIWHVSNTKTPYSRDVLRSYLLNAHRDIRETQQFRFIILLHEPQNRPGNHSETKRIGTIDLFDYDLYHSRAGIGILIKDPSHREKGYGRESLDILCRYGFEVLLLHQLYCHVGKGNIPSLNLFQHAGFRIAGTKKEWNRTKSGWEDEIILQKINPDHKDNPS
jgi:diamine N-acetyltransferase